MGRAGRADLRRLDRAGAAATCRSPTTDDLDYHLSTMFPPVRPRGYLEIRYLDAQPGDGWIHPFVLLCALMSSPASSTPALAAAEPARDRWFAGRPARSARTRASAPRPPRVVDLGCAALADLDLAAATRAAVARPRCTSWSPPRRRRCSA